MFGLDVLAQSYTYRYETTSAGGGAVAAVLVLVYLVFLAAIYAVSSFALMKLFQKAGRKDAWAAWVPYYNSWVMSEISGREGWWGLIPILNLLVIFDFVRSFGKDQTFAILSVLFPILLLVLAFDKNTKYAGPAASTSPIAPVAKK